MLSNLHPTMADYIAPFLTSEGAINNTGKKALLKERLLTLADEKSCYDEIVEYLRFPRTEEGLILKIQEIENK